MVIWPSAFVRAGQGLGWLLLLSWCWAWSHRSGRKKEKMDMAWGTADTTEILVCQTLAPMPLSPWLQICNLAAEHNPRKWCSRCGLAFTPGQDLAKEKKENLGKPKLRARQLPPTPTPPTNRVRVCSGAWTKPTFQELQWLLLHCDLPDTPQISLEANLNQEYSVRRTLENITKLKQPESGTWEVFGWRCCSQLEPWEDSPERLGCLCGAQGRNQCNQRQRGGRKKQFDHILQALNPVMPETTLEFSDVGDNKFVLKPVWNRFSDTTILT